MTGSENRGERNQEGINSDRTWSRCDREVRYGVYSRAAGLLRQRCEGILQQAPSGVNFLASKDQFDNTEEKH